MTFFVNKYTMTYASLGKLFRKWTFSGSKSIHQSTPWRRKMLAHGFRLTHWTLTVEPWKFLNFQAVIPRPWANCLFFSFLSMTSFQDLPRFTKFTVVTYVKSSELWYLLTSVFKHFELYDIFVISRIFPEQMSANY